MLSRDTRSERKLKLLRRTEFRFKQGLERIDWEEDVLVPEVNAFKAQARLPELPSEMIFDVSFDSPQETPRGQRKARKS